MRYRRATMRAVAGLRVDESGQLLLGVLDGDAMTTVARAAIRDLRLSRQTLPTPGASIVVDFGDSSWLIDFFGAQVHAASTTRSGQPSWWRAQWNANRPIKTTRGAHRLRQRFIDAMVSRGATLARGATLDLGS